MVMKIYYEKYYLSNGSLLTKQFIVHYNISMNLVVIIMLVYYGTVVGFVSYK